ncbi:hypothetical protein FOXG_15823 [Fusarium oxysporum f. sp. lycopersici 4287]|uniref:NmrA-like domain-containing protein n=2 Tax=Fusarium oxysporum TaxID=5507 RepID=A0A0J9W5R5_FUSO4|nr:hypothetical protein FOXG_15823 [Fusarium oxysporum f. sp. lycopersici 4287]EXK26697.1 hypothetical protein FOMG_16758 [Fusarium oxysporum f. sp. melonis 26406]KNB18198.1 hypothetical protein FOXG_15823 [Fusarium oxysporum f. sp. lycopersici 4287]
MVVLIAGITGNLGQRLASAAISRGLSVRGLGRNSSKLQSDISRKLESFVTSKTHYDIDALDQAGKGVDSIICAYNGDPILTVEGGSLLLLAAERAGVKVFNAATWNNDWSKIKYGDFEHYDTNIAFQHYAAWTSSINPIYIFTGYFSDLYLTKFGPGSLTVDDEGKKVSLRVAEIYRRVSGRETEVKRMGDVADLERHLANLRLKHGRTGLFAYMSEAGALIDLKGDWEFKPEELTVLDHVKKPRSFEEGLKEHLKSE